jgi:hypothetical protein
MNVKDSDVQYVTDRAKYLLTGGAEELLRAFRYSLVTAINDLPSGISKYATNLSNDLMYKNGGRANAPFLSMGDDLNFMAGGLGSSVTSKPGARGGKSGGAGMDLTIGARGGARGCLMPLSVDGVQAINGA